MKWRLDRRIDKHGARLLRALQDLARAAGTDSTEAAPLVRKVVTAASALQRDLPVRIPQWQALAKIVAGGTAFLDGDVAGGMSQIDAGYIAFEAEGRRS